MTERTTLDLRPQDHHQQRKQFTEDGIPVSEGELASFFSFEEHRVKVWLRENCGQAPSATGLETRPIKR